MYIHWTHLISLSNRTTTPSYFLVTTNIYVCWDSSIIMESYRQSYTNEIISDNHSTVLYGRCIHISIGLLVGLIIDKALLYITKGASTLLPPVSVLLMSRGRTLYNLRFERRFNPLIERLIRHLTHTNK